MIKGNKFTQSEMEIYNNIRNQIDTTPINKCLDLMDLDDKMWVDLKMLNCYLDKNLRRINTKDLSKREKRNLTNLVGVIRRRINKYV